MKALIGISNPGTKQFLWTRHNIGRLFITDHLLKRYKHTSTKNSKYYEYRLLAFPNLIICLSETFMNLSGQAVTPFMRRNPELTKKDIIVVHDDLQHKFGNVRIKEGGSAQGHNGITSMIGALGGNEFRRLQLGIDRPASRDPEAVASYVLSNFNKAQRQNLDKTFMKAEELLKKQGYLKTG